MLLAIDAGNTNCVFALVDGDEIKTRWRIATDPRRTADEYAVWLHQLLALEGYGRGDVSQVIIGTVVPRALHNLEVLSKNISTWRRLSRGKAVLNGRSCSTSTNRTLLGPIGYSTPSLPTPSTRAT